MIEKLRQLSNRLRDSGRYAADECDLAAASLIDEAIAALTAQIVWEGKLFDVGNIEARRGFAVEVDGQDCLVGGLTMEECRTVGALLYQRVRVSITVSPLQPGGRL